MSRCLAERSIDHVLLERGEVAHSWRTERWDSLRLLTPNWQSRLPGFRYDGNDPDGYRTLPEVIDFIASYAKSISAPVRTHTTVTSVRSDGDGISRAHGPRRLALPDRRHRLGRVQHRARPELRRQCAAVGRDADGAIVSQSGPARRRRRPGRGRFRRAAPRSRTSCSARGARSRSRSASTSGRRASIAARIWNGGWTPPACSTSATTRWTTSRGRGGFPRCSLPARPTARPWTSTALTDIGVRLVGRLAGITEDGKAQFAGSLRNMCALSDLKMRRLLDLLDEWARANGLDGTVEPPDRLPPTRVEDSAPARHGSRQERDQDDRLGRRLSAGLFLAGAAGSRPQGLWSRTTAASSARPAST